MTKQEVMEKTMQVVRDCFPDMEDVQMDENTVVNTDTGIDSMGFVLIICKLEALFDVRVPERQWKKLATLGDVVEAIYSRLPK